MRVKGQLANPGLPEKLAVKMMCVCVCVYNIRSVYSAECLRVTQHFARTQ